MEAPDRTILIQLSEKLSTGSQTRPVYVAKEHITSIYADNDGTHVTTTRDHFVVKETPKEIFGTVFLVARPARMSR